MNDLQNIILGSLAFVTFLVVFIAWLFKERDLYKIFPQEIMTIKVSPDFSIRPNHSVVSILDDNEVDYERISDKKTKYILMKKGKSETVYLFAINEIEIQKGPQRNSYIVRFSYGDLIYSGEETPEYFDRNRNFFKTIITR